MAKAMKKQNGAAPTGVQPVKKKQKAQVQQQPMKKAKAKAAGGQPVGGKPEKIKGTEVRAVKGGGLIRVVTHDKKEFPIEAKKGVIKHLKAIGKYVEPQVQGVKKKGKGGPVVPPHETKAGRKRQKRATANNQKIQCLNLISKILHKALSKEDVVFENAQVAEGFQCTARAPCLPGYGSTQFTGPAAETAKEAEQNAASEILKVINSNAGLMQQVAAAKEAAKQKKRERSEAFMEKHKDAPWFQRKGKGKGKGKGW